MGGREEGSPVSRDLDDSSSIFAGAPLVMSTTLNGESPGTKSLWVLACTLGTYLTLPRAPASRHRHYLECLLPPFPLILLISTG